MKNIRKLYRNIIIIFVLAGLLLGLFGCDINNNSTEESAKIPVVTETDSEYVAEQGGELDIALPAIIESWNPLIAENEDLINFLSLIYEKPLVINEEGKFEPCLVETWNTNDEGTVYTFSLRKNIKYHNGDDFDAYDIKNTIQILADLYNVQLNFIDYNEIKENVSTNNDNDNDDITAETLQEDISSKQYITDVLKNKWAQYFSIIESIEIADEYTIKITMTKPGREALYFMTFPVINDNSDYDDLNGTGPYYLSEKTDAEYTLLINQSWWKNLPYIEKITARSVESYSDKQNEFGTNLLNFYSTNNISASKQKSTGNTEIQDYNTNYYDCLVFNLFNDKCKDVNVRKAVSYAIDRRTLVSSVLLNHATVAEMPIKPDFYAYNVKYKMYEYDESYAIDFLENSGYTNAFEEGGNPLELNIIVPDEIGYEYRLEAAQVISDALVSIGILCTVSVLSSNEYMTRLINNDFDIAYCSYYLDDNPDVSFMLKTDASGNYGNIASSELDDILNECSNAITENDVINAYDKLQQYFIEKVPQVGLFYRTFSVVYDSKIKNVCDLGENSLFRSISKWSIDLS